MPNDFFNSDGNPANNSAGRSSVIRTVFSNIAAAFDKLAGLSGNGGKVVGINSDGTAQEALSTTGTGNVVKATSPTLTTPALGVATATSVNKVAITAPATAATLTIADGKTLTASNTMTLTGSDGATLNISDAATLTALAASSGASLSGFIQSGTGAVASTLEAKARQEFSALDFMSDAQRADVISGTGSINVTAAVQAAIDACSASTGEYERGGIVKFPDGNYLCSGGLTINKNIMLFGSGNATLSGNVSATAQKSMIYVGGSANLTNSALGYIRVVIRRLNIRPTGHEHCIKSDGVRTIRVEECTVAEGTVSSIRIKQAWSTSHIKECWFQGGGYTALEVLDNSNAFVIHKNRFAGYDDTASGLGLYISASSGVWVTHNDFEYSLAQITAIGTASGQCNNLHIENNWIEGAAGHSLRLDNTTYGFKGFTFRSNSVYGTPSGDVEIGIVGGAGTFEGFVVDGNTFNSPSLPRLLSDASKYLSGSVTGNFPHVANAGVAVNSSSDGLIVTQSGSGAALRVTQVGTGNVLVVEDSVNIDSSAFIIGNSGTMAAGRNAVVAGTAFRFDADITGSTAGRGMLLSATYRPDVTSTGITFTSLAGTDASAFTLADMYHFSASQGTLGAGSAVTNQIGFIANAMTGATNNYGFFANLAAASNRWNFYAPGTANNAYAGNSSFGNASVPTAKVHIAAGTATASTAPLKLTAGANLTTPETGAVEYNGTNLFFTRSGAVREGVLTQSAVTTETVVSDTTVTVNIGGTEYKLLARA
jgi:hypothetical protein